MKDKFSISGMTCSACSAGIERTLGRLNGIQKVEVSLMGEYMSVEYDENILSPQDIIQSVVDLGYGATLFKQATLKEIKPHWKDWY